MIKNLVLLVGRLTADPELRYTPQGTPVATFSVAVNRSFRKPDGGWKDDLDGYFDCELWSGPAVTFTEEFQKGSLVQLTGSLRQKKFQTSGDQPRTLSRVEVKVDTISPVVEAAKDDAESTVPQEQPEPQPA